MPDENFETITQMKLNHLPNDARLVLQRQKGGVIPKDAVQFGLPTTFVNSANGQTVWNRGPSIQVEQIPELIQILTDIHKKYSDNHSTEKSKERTGTFADCVDW